MAFMTIRTHSWLALGVAASAALGVTVLAQSPATLNFDANADVLQLPSYGEVAGVATNSRGQIFVYVRPTRWRRSATSGRSITAARGCFSSTRAGSSSRKSARDSTG